MEALERPPGRAEWASAVGGFCGGEDELDRFDEQLRIMVRYEPLGLAPRRAHVRAR